MSRQWISNPRRGLAFARNSSRGAQFRCFREFIDLERPGLFDQAPFDATTNRLRCYSRSARTNSSAIT
jgi:hypothetical protein